MISKDKDGRWIVTGARLPLHQLWEFFDKYELIHDMIDGKLYSDDWNKETSREKKISDMLKGDTVISGSVVSDYLKFRDWKRKFVDIRIVEEKLRMLEKKIGDLSNILSDILVSNLEIKKLLTSDAFIDLKLTYDCVLLGLSKVVDNKRVLLTNPSKGVKIEMGDHILLMTNGETKKRIEIDFGIFEGRI